jgi:tRNA G18 (ribose-2'-O)-methylase SpoU
MSRTLQEKAERRFLQEKFLNAARSRPGVGGFTVVLDHLKPDYNVGKIFRTADAFGAEAVWLVGMGWFDPGPAVGSFKHVPARFFATFGEAFLELEAAGLPAYRLEPEHGEPLPTAEFPRRCALVMGNEGVGHSFTREQFPTVKSLRIPQWGRAQSLNVSVAAAVAMYEHCRRFGGEAPAVGEKNDRQRAQRGG